MRIKIKSLFTILLVMFLVRPLFCQNTATLAVKVKVEKRFRLEVSTSFISFSRVSSSGFPQTIPANEGPFEMKIKTNCTSSTTTNVWLIAQSDLVDGSTGFTIPVERIWWEAEGLGFYPGRLNKVFPVILARLKGPGEYSGKLSFNFDEDPGLAPGVYNTTVTILVEGV
ncbi:MAG: hypothetical protein WBI18_01585 [Candidatus Saccharicenans sp.]